MKYVFCIVISLLFRAEAKCQCVNFKIDTLTVFEMNLIGESGSINSGFVFIGINTDFYDGSNFPFDCYSCEPSNLYENPLFIRSYDLLMNEKSIKHFRKTFSRKNSHLFNVSQDKISESFNSCLVNYKHQFIIKKQRIVALYFLLECKNAKGIGSPMLCEKNVFLTKIPVILDVLEIIN